MRFLIISSVRKSIPEITRIWIIIAWYVRYADPFPVYFITVTATFPIVNIIRNAFSILRLFFCIISEKIADFVKGLSSINKSIRLFIHLPLPEDSIKPNEYYNYAHFHKIVNS